MILHQSIVEQMVDRDERDRFVKELVVVRFRSAGGKEVPLAMIRKRHASRVRKDAGLGGTLAPVLLVHGYGQNRYAWHLPARSFSNYLARAGFDVFNLDLRGHGRSRHLGAHRPNHIADHVREDVPAAIEEIQRISGGRPVYYVGHSMGGLIGYAAAPSLGSALGGVATLGSPYHFARGSWPLMLAGNLMLAVDRKVPIGHVAAPLKPLGEAMRLLRAFVESPLFPVPIRGFAARSMEPTVLGQHMSLAMDAGSVVVLKNLFLGGVESRRSGHRLGGLTGYAGAFEKLDLPLLIIAGSKDDLAPPASVLPAYESSRARDKTYRTFPQGHIDLIVGRDAPLTIWPLIESWLRRRTRASATPPEDAEDERRTARGQR
jgi:alpha-beta hydrolase superfamily lysophospholipase